MESWKYRSRCSQQGPGEDHLTRRWVTQREGKGWEPESPGPQGLREEVKCLREEVKSSSLADCQGKKKLLETEGYNDL